MINKYEMQVDSGELATGAFGGFFGAIVLAVLVLVWRLCKRLRHSDCIVGSQRFIFDHREATPAPQSLPADVP